MRTISKIGTAIGWLMLCSIIYAQGPPNSMLIGTEGITITSTTGSGVVFQFGNGPYNTVAVYSLPLSVSCANPSTCEVLGNDPDPGVLKSIYAVEQATAYTVTLADGTVKSVPALVCGLPAAFTVNPPIPPVPPKCALYPGSQAVATDGQMVAVTALSAPVYFQYCQGTICDAPFQWWQQPIFIGSVMTLGGPVGGTGVGTLYILPSASFVGLAVAQGPIKAIAIPAGK